jgi:hypothetical protein
VVIIFCKSDKTMPWQQYHKRVIAAIKFMVVFVDTVGCKVAARFLYFATAKCRGVK